MPDRNNLRKKRVISLQFEAIICHGGRARHQEFEELGHMVSMTRKKKARKVHA